VLTLLPTLLALLGTALMAVVIFAPVSASAAHAPAAERYSPLPFDAFAAEAFNAPFHAPEAMPYAETYREEPAWPALVDPSAAACEPVVRLALVEALTAVRAPWADAILRRALLDETDARVLTALERAT
jgi:hypothetical protein